MSKFADQVKEVPQEILTSTLMAIDPSSGSRASQPGYSIWKGGVLVDSGIIKVPLKSDLNRRLFYLADCLRSQFEAPTVLAIENIPPFMSGKGFSRSILSLQRAVGTIMSVWNVPLVEVAPSAWRSMIPELYNKTDEADAIMIGWATIQTARSVVRLAKQPIEGALLTKLTTGNWSEYPDVGRKLKDEA